MPNRAGIGSLMRAGPAPGRAGLSHLARGEAVIPNAAMQADPALRRRAMMAMASRGRNPMQYTVGQQNLRNPSTGMPMFADLVYVDGQYVDASTGQPASFGGGNSTANTGTFAPPPTAVSGGGSNLANLLAQIKPVIQQVNADSGSGGGEPGTGGYSFHDALSSAGAVINSVNNQAPPTQQPDTSYAPPAQDQADFASFSAPQTYDQWSQSRNPTGKNMPNTLFGQTQTAGSDGGFSTGGMQMPNVLAGQMPVPGAQWGTPGTALGFGRENTANDPSILRSGYNDMSLSPSIYSNAFGGAGGMMGQQSGIAFSGQNPMSPGQGNQQKQYGGNFGFSSAFRY